MLSKIGVRAVSVMSLAFFCCGGLAPNFASAQNSEPELPSGSRIRLFGENGFGLWFYKNSTCYRKILFKPVGGETISGSISQSFASFQGKATSAGIGMPETLASKAVAAGSDTKFYKELAVESEKPVTILASFGNAGWNCGAIASTFTPKPGKDYEGFLEISWSEKVCRLVLKEISKTEDGVVLVPIEGVASATKCD